MPVSGTRILEVRVRLEGHPQAVSAYLCISCGTVFGRRLRGSDLDLTLWLRLMTNLMTSRFFNKFVILKVRRDFLRGRRHFSRDHGTTFRNIRCVGCAVRTRPVLPIPPLFLCARRIQMNALCLGQTEETELGAFRTFFYSSTSAGIYQEIVDS